jgi:predicted nucleotide-binding protein
MAQLPYRATTDDIVTFCGYLQSKPTGATVAEAKAVLDATILDARKVSAYKFLGLVDDSTGKMRVTDRGRAIARDKGARKATEFRSIVADVPAYRAIVDRAVHKGELTVTATDVGAHWHQHFRSDASDSDEILNQQAICFFQLAEGADLGRLIVGRKGQPTRFEFVEENARPFVESSEVVLTHDEPVSDDVADDTPEPKTAALAQPTPSVAPNNRIFVTHGKNTKILEQIKRTITSVGLEPVVSVQTETAAKPVPQKVMDDMRKCSAVVIHVGSEAELLDKNGRGWPINPNVLIEIGAAMMHCPGRYVLVVEDGIELPSNLQGLYQCRYTGDGLDFDAVMKIQEALKGLK